MKKYIKIYYDYEEWRILARNYSDMETFFTPFYQYLYVQTTTLMFLYCFFPYKEENRLPVGNCSTFLFREHSIWTLNGHIYKSTK